MVRGWSLAPTPHHLIFDYLISDIKTGVSTCTGITLEHPPPEAEPKNLWAWVPIDCVNEHMLKKVAQMCCGAVCNSASIGG